LVQRASYSSPFLTTENLPPEQIVSATLTLFGRFEVRFGRFEVRAFAAFAMASLVVASPSY
jgi:hypothetical protein